MAEVAGHGIPRAGGLARSSMWASREPQLRSRGGSALEHGVVAPVQKVLTKKAGGSTTVGCSGAGAHIS